MDPMAYEVTRNSTKGTFVPQGVNLVGTNQVVLGMRLYFENLCVCLLL